MDPTYAAGYFGLGRVREAQGDVREAERIYTLAARLRSGAGQALELRARLRYNSGRKLEALSDLSEAIRQAPANVPRLELASQWYVKEQAWAAALAVWRRLLALYTEQQLAEPARRARIQVQALVLLAAETDPVTSSSRSGWIPKALKRIGKRGG